MKEFEACDFTMAKCDSLTSMPRARHSLHWGYYASSSAGMPVHSFRPVLDSSELTIGCFLLILLRVVLGLTMFAVTSGYSVSEKVLVWE